MYATQELKKLAGKNARSVDRNVEGSALNSSAHTNVDGTDDSDGENRGCDVIFSLPQLIVIED